MVEVAVGPVFETLKRAEVREGLEALGARVVDRIGEHTDLLVAGGFGQTRRTKSQAKAARKDRARAIPQGLPIWNEYAVAARLDRGGPLDRNAVRDGALLRTADQARGLTWSAVSRVGTSAEFGALLPAFQSFVRGRFRVTPELDDLSLDVCDAAMLDALGSGDVRGDYELLTFNLEGRLLRSMVHVPSSNATSFVFSATGDFLYELSELMGDSDADSLAVCALVQMGDVGEALGDLLERGDVNEQTHGWADHLG